MRSSRTASLLAAGAAAVMVPVLLPATASAAPSATGPLDPYLSQKPAWHRCSAETPASFQCATIKVPLDYGKPGGRKLDLAISRWKTSTKRQHRGALLLNPGGPGGSGLDMPLFMGGELPKSVKNTYDLVGFDPRGVGESSPVGCGLTDKEQDWERPYKEATFAKDVAWARNVAAKCYARQGDRLRHLSTRDTARDMDVIRAVLGEKRISYLGYSYGTYLGAVYTQLFPTRTDRFVLDSAVDPARVWRGMIQVWAEGAEPAFARWTEWTAERNSAYRLGATPQAVRKTFYDLVAQADRKPIDVDGTRMTGADIRLTSRATFFSVRDAAEWVVTLKKAAAGKPAGRGLKSPAPVPPSFAGATPPSFARATPPEDNGTAAFWSVLCADQRDWPRDPEQYRADAIRDRKKYPLYGDFGSSVKPCAFWKTGGERTTKVDNKVRALILQNEWDPQTPLTSGQGLRRAMKGAKMVTVAGGVGHGVYGNKSCADKTATAYLTTGKLPSKDITCEAAPQAAGRGGLLPLPLPGSRGLPGPGSRF
ncbi:alpha/beta hydrolase [Streptomyces achromogenes]|uniref:alpha/beta hydrolase n=1 Tax=Streptomyces achromogenes TaxID=67255 RepID=UPI003F4CC6B4